MTNTKKVSSFIFSLAVALMPQLVRAEVLPEEVSAMKQRFVQGVGSMPMENAYEKLLIERTTTLLLNHLNGSSVVSQYFLLVDRNAEMQTISLAFLNSEGQEVIILGSSKTSTGNPARIGFYETPVGVFKNIPSNMSYRALGTKNSKGWRGLGAKGSRVWDLGWQPSKHHKGGNIDIRLLVHATDPDAGESRLGKRDSKGCIRLAATFNRFLDYYGVLDAEYEGSEKGKRIFLKDREPVALAGNLVVVVDSTP